MIKITNLTIRDPLKWAQPSLKYHYELKFGETLAATLDFRNAWGTFATAQSGDGVWTFKRVGFWQNRATIRVEDSEQDLAEFTNSTWRRGGTLEFVHGRIFKATTNFWMTEMEWLREDEEPLVQFDIGGFFKHNADVEILPDAIGIPELPILVMFGWYLILMLYRDAAAASSAAAASN